jgi:hypothetical protein
MAPRTITKTESRRKNAPQSRRTVASATPTGNTAFITAGESNGASPSFEQIQRRAYELFLGRGAIHGYDWADWLRAEQELIETSNGAH